MNAQERSPWPHRMAWVLCCATFPLVWVGGLITTTDAGMAVPDWPGTYGYNMFLYPWQTWFFGPWDLFIEHGHRLLASGVGLLTVALLVVVWRTDKRVWLRWLTIGALLLVIGQGVLGGLRVVLNTRYLAMVHGSVGPLFFALTAAIVVLTLPNRSQANRPRCRDFWLVGLLYTQLTLGATLRHAPEDESFSAFATHVLAHLTMAVVVSVGILVASRRAWCHGGAARLLGAVLAGGVLLQLLLGVSTWITEYGLPGWAQGLWPGTLTPSTAGGWLETHTVTAHSALGSLLLALATGLALLPRAQQETRIPPAEPSPLPPTR